MPVDVMAPPMRALYVKTLSEGTSVEASCCVSVGGEDVLLLARAETGVEVWAASDGALARRSAHPVPKGGVPRVASLIACGRGHVLIATAEARDGCEAATTCAGRQSHSQLLPLDSPSL